MRLRMTGRVGCWEWRRSEVVCRALNPFTIEAIWNPRRLFHFYILMLSRSDINYVEYWTAIAMTGTSWLSWLKIQLIRSNLRNL